MAKETKAIRKQQQITKSARNMFVSIAIASALVGFAVVTSIFLINKIVFNQRVISAKNKTLKDLRNNNANLPALKNEIAILETNEALRSSRVDSEQDAIRVVIDALPATDNPTALGASVRKLLSVEGVRVEDLVVSSGGSVVDGEPTDEGSVDSDAASTSDKSLNAISFQFKAVGSVDVLNQVLKKLEQSIRAMSVDTVDFEIATDGDGQDTLTVVAHSFYQPMMKAELGEITMEARRK